jgi:large subunit ribosomal protein L5
MTERRRSRSAVDEPMPTDASTEDDMTPETPETAEAAPVAESMAVAEPVTEPEAQEEAAPEPAEAAATEAAAEPMAAAEPEPADMAEEAEPAADMAAEPEPADVAEEAEPAADVAPEPAAEPEPIAAATAEPAAEPASERAPRAPKARPDADAPIMPRPTGPRGLRARYLSEVVPALTKQFEYSNPNMVPKLDKIVVNIGLGEALTNAKAIDAAAGDLSMITGQKPIVMKARRSIAQFKIRTGNPIGLKVTLRGQRMWDFLERLTMLALPRIRDFRGTPGRSFDGRGNYTLGVREQISFPEIDYDKVDRLRGLEVSIVTTAKSDEESKRLLELLGMPFAS